MFRRFRFHRLLLALLGIAFSCAARPAAAQGSYCNITRISSRTLTNAVEITVQADGLMRVDWDSADFFDIAGFSRGGIEKVWKPVSVLPFRIANARSQVGPFTDVSTYPVSHVEVAIPPDTRDGIGVNLQVVLFRDATPVSVQTPWGIDLSRESRPGSTVSVTLTPDRTRLLILVTSDRQVLSSDDKTDLPPGAPVALSVTSEDANVTIHALNADVRDVVREVARNGGYDFAVNGLLERTVSLELPATPFDEALDAIAMACGLTLDRSGGVIRAADGRANSLPAYEQGGFETIPLLHITAASARGGLPDALMRYLHLDARHNALTVFGPKPLIEKVRSDLAVLDRPVPQIQVDVLIVEFASRVERDRLLRVRGTTGENTLEADTGTGDITFFTSAPLPDGFSAELRALARAGKAHLRAQPHAVVRNGATANLFVGQQRYIKVTEYNRLQNVDYATLIPVNLGVSLRVTPWTGDQRDIILEVAPEVSTVAEREANTGLPTVFTRNASATIRVAKGDTAIIGGLLEDQMEKHYRRIPILGDLPLIGGLFRTVEHRRAQRELTLFVTARVLADTEMGKPIPQPAFPNGDRL